jgi:hypothetical protein
MAMLCGHGRDPWQAQLPSGELTRPCKRAAFRTNDVSPEMTSARPQRPALEINYVPGKGLLAPGTQIGGGYADGTQNG